MLNFNLLDLRYKSPTLKIKKLPRFSEFICVAIFKYLVYMCQMSLHTEF